MTLLTRTRWSNGVLFALAVLSVVLVLQTRHSGRGREQPARLRHLVSQYNAESVSRLVLTRDGQTVEISRNTPSDTANSTRWSMTAPVETDVEISAVDQLLGTLRYATWLRRTETRVDDPTSPTLVVHQPTGSLVLRLGGPSAAPVGSHFVNVHVEGQPSAATVVINERVVRDVFVPLEVFRGRQLVPYRKSSVERIVLSSAAGTRRLVERNGVFRFDQMQEGQRAERKGLDRIFLALARSVADPFVELGVARAALSVQSTVRVSLLARDRNKPEASLEFGGECPGQPSKALAVRHLPQPLAGCVDKSVLTVLREPADTLVDRGLFPLSRDEVDTLRVVSGQGTMTLLRDGKGFALRSETTSVDADSVSSQTETRVDAEVAEDRLRRILSVRGDLVSRRNKPRGGAKFAHAIVTMESSAVPGRERVVETIRISKPRKKTGAVWAYRDSDEAVLLLSAGSALALRADTTLLKPLAVFDYPLSEVRGLKVEGSKTPQTLKRSSAGAFTLVRPKRYALDEALATEVLDRLRNFSAVRWITDRDSTAFGLGKPRLVATLQLQGEKRQVERTLRVGRSAPGGYYASVDRNPGVFVLPRAVVRSLETSLLDRGVFRVDRDSIFELSLTSGKRRLLVRRVAGDLTVIKAPASFDADNLDLVIEALGNLHAEAAIHLGRAERGEGLRRPRLKVSVRRRSPRSVGASRLRFQVGSRDTFQGASVYYARRSKVNATYALPRRQVQSLLDLF